MLLHVARWDTYLLVCNSLLVQAVHLKRARGEHGRGQEEQGTGTSSTQELDAVTPFGDFATHYCPYVFKCSFAFITARNQDRLGEWIPDALLTTFQPLSFHIGSVSSSLALFALPPAPAPRPLALLLATIASSQHHSSIPTASPQTLLRSTISPSPSLLNNIRRQAGRSELRALCSLCWQGAEERETVGRISSPWPPSFLTSMRRLKACDH